MNIRWGTTVSVECNSIVTVHGGATAEVIEQSHWWCSASLKLCHGTWVRWLHSLLVWQNSPNVWFTNLKTLRILSTGSFVFLPLWARHVVFSGKTVDNIRYNWSKYASLATCQSPQTRSFKLVRWGWLEWLRLSRHLSYHRADTLTVWQLDNIPSKTLHSILM